MENSILDDDFANNEINLDDVEFAGFWIRVGASLIDMLILIPIYILGIYNSLSLKSILFMLIITTLGAIYKPYLEWKRSATLGKSAVGIKLVDETLNDISGEQAIKRYFPWIISSLISITLNYYVFTAPEFQNVDQFMQLGLLLQESPVSSINSIYSVVFIILIGSLIFDSRKQGFHDKFAGTYCVKDNQKLASQNH